MSGWSEFSSGHTCQDMVHLGHCEDGAVREDSQLVRQIGTGSIAEIEACCECGRECLVHDPSTPDACGIEGKEVN